jgi:uncharacterized membrane protein
MTSGNPEAQSDAAVFDAVLYPHRSLGRRGFRILLVTVALLSTLMSVPFYLMGAWPVMGFFGLDIALLYVMFQLNYRDGRLEERVTLTLATLHVSRMERRGRRREWTFNPRWVRLARQDHEEFGLLRLALVQRGDEVEIARCLGAEEKADFASAFTRALASVRRGIRQAP